MCLLVSSHCTTEALCCGDKKQAVMTFQDKQEVTLQSRAVSLQARHSAEMGLVTLHTHHAPRRHA